MTAIQAMELELRKIQKAQAECITESGYVLSEHKHRYQMLVEKARNINESIKWLKELYSKPATRN